MTNRKRPVSKSPQQKAKEEAEKVKTEAERANYVDQRELKYESDFLNKKRFFSQQ